MMETTNQTLNTIKPSKFIAFNRLFAAVYTFAVLTLLYYHVLKLITNSHTKSSIFISISMLIADLLLAFTWSTGQAFRMYPVTRKPDPEKIIETIGKSGFPDLDVFICTADPYKEHPISVVNTALSVMAYDYPTEKLSVYISDDGGSQLTLFAFMEAVKFGKYWLPFCRENDIMERCPHAFFGSNCEKIHQSEKIKVKLTLISFFFLFLITRMFEHYINQILFLLVSLITFFYFLYLLYFKHYIPSNIRKYEIYVD